MLRLRSCILTHFIPSHSASYAVSPLHRLLSAAASASPAFAVEQYLVGTCGLTREQALKASTKLSHLKSPTNPDTVLAYLAGLGLSSADTAALVAKDPQFLCASVERTLGPVVVGLAGHGLSNAEIARLVSVAPDKFRCRSVVSTTRYLLSIFGSSESFLRAIKRRSRLLSCDFEKAVKPNVAFLRECRLGACDISKLCVAFPGLLVTNLERLKVMVACAESLGVPRGSGMFRKMLHGLAFLSEEKFTARMENLKNTFRWSDTEVIIAVSKGPMLLTRSKETLQRISKFVISKMGLEPSYIAHRPSMLTYSLECRIRPRYYVLKFLKENGLVDRDRDYNAAFKLTEKVFVEKYLCPHNKVVPHLVEDYAAACRGEVPTNFRFA